VTALTVEQRWEEGISHDSRSEELYHELARIDRTEGNDFFWFTCGGDGDNGEHLMYLLDIFFEEEDLKPIIKFAEENPEEWKLKFGDEGYHTMEEEVRAYFAHYANEENLVERVRIDLGI